jgi:endonuclease YncB( thermonuclease family)
MRNGLGLLFVSLLMGCSAGSFSRGLLPVNSLGNGDSCQHSETSFRCVRVVSVYDADTIFVDLPEIHPLFGRRIGIRVAGIDAPELRTRNSCEKNRALQAKSLVQRLVNQANRIDIINVQRDKYFRVLGTVLIDGQSLSEELLSRQLAYPYTGGRKQRVNWC